MRRVIPALIFALAGCGDATAPDAGPAWVQIETATAAAGQSSDFITLRLSNKGGEGAYYVQFAEAPVDPGGGYRTAESVPVEVAVGYTESVQYIITNGTIATVRVFSRPPNSDEYRRSDCRALRGDAIC